MEMNLQRRPRGRPRKHAVRLDSSILKSLKPETVNHPAHYGGADNPYEAIKVIEAWELGFNLGNAVKYIARAGKKGDRHEDLAKALWYLNREIQNLKGREHDRS